MIPELCDACSQERKPLIYCAACQFSKCPTCFGLNVPWERGRCRPCIVAGLDTTRDERIRSKRLPAARRPRYASARQ